MKKAFIVFITLLIASPLHAQHIRGEYPIAIRIDDSVFPKYLCYSKHRRELGIYNLLVNRNNKRQPVTLLFRAGGNTNVWLYHEDDYYKSRASRNHYDLAIKHGYDPEYVDPVVIDLTSLKDGDYVAECSSCTYGGIIKISLITE